MQIEGGRMMQSDGGRVSQSDGGKVVPRDKVVPRERGTAGARLIYLHGFRSSSRSHKARLLAARMEQLGIGAAFVCPDLPPSPAGATALLRTEVAPRAIDTLVGSSLGGYYATWLAEECGCRAVLVNPVVHAVRELQSRIGPQTGWHDGQPFEFGAQHVEELRALQVAAVTQPSRYWLIAGTADEVLDWREMVAHYPRCRQTLVHGGDHALAAFEAWIDEVLRFAGLHGIDG